MSKVCAIIFQNGGEVLFQAVSLAFIKATQHSVHPTGGSLRVFRQFSWLGVGSVKMVLSRPTHQRVTRAVGLLKIDVHSLDLRKSSYMLQPLQIPDSLLFLGFSVLMIAIFIPTFLWGLRKVVNNMKKSTGFTNPDIVAVRRQMLALLVMAPVVLLFFAGSRLLLDRPSPYTVFIGLILGFVPLAYIAVSAIRNRILIAEGGYPVKGAKAVRGGVISLVFLILMFGGFAIYALYFVSWK